jgi:hypothetical protein
VGLRVRVRNRVRAKLKVWFKLRDRVTVTSTIYAENGSVHPREVAAKEGWTW